jgi:prepilin-type N-terminal cleavage/methylation domain-containing protein
MTDSRPDGGFTLIEILVAVTILALAAALASQIFSNGATNMERADFERAAIQSAESILNRVGSEFPVQTGHVSGADMSQTWTLDIGEILEDPKPEDGLAAFPVRVVIRWTDDRGAQQFALDSIRLGRLPVTP